MRLSPRLLANSESPLLNEWVDMAHREFLRMTEVTDKISESKMCFRQTEAEFDAIAVGLAVMSAAASPQICRVPTAGRGQWWWVETRSKGTVRVT